MRIAATNEEDAIALLEKKDLYSALAATNAFILALCLASFAIGYVNWAVAYLCLLSAMEGAFFITRSKAMDKRVIDVGGCYVEYDQDGIRCRQPALGRYESFDVNLKDVEKIVEGDDLELPEFYILLRDGARDGRITVGDEAVRRKAVHVRSFGYNVEDFKEFMERMSKEERFAGVMVTGGKLKNQKICKKARKALVAAGLVGAYFIPLLATLPTVIIK